MKGGGERIWRERDGETWREEDTEREMERGGRWGERDRDRYSSMLAHDDYDKLTAP